MATLRPIGGQIDHAGTVQLVTNAEDEAQRLSAGKGRRLVIIVVCATLVSGTTTIVRFVGDRRVAHEVGRIRQRASTVRVEPASLFSTAFGGGTDPIAEALATDATTREIQGLEASWCAKLEVQRLISKRSVTSSSRHRDNSWKPLTA